MSSPNQDLDLEYMDLQFPNTSVFFQGNVKPSRKQVILLLLLETNTYIQTLHMFINNWCVVWWLVVWTVV